MSNPVAFHVGGVRLRILGNGTFVSKLASLDNARTSDLANITLATTGENERFLHANFESRRIRFEGNLSNTVGRFEVKHITFYIKPVALDYPQ